MSDDEPPIPFAEIRQRAYELWDRNHRPEGLEMEFWLAAERALRLERRQRRKPRDGSGSPEPKSSR